MILAQLVATVFAFNLPCFFLANATKQIPNFLRILELLNDNERNQEELPFTTTDNGDQIKNGKRFSRLTAYELSKLEEPDVQDVHQKQKRRHFKLALVQHLRGSEQRDHRSYPTEDGNASLVENLGQTVHGLFAPMEYTNNWERQTNHGRLVKDKRRHFKLALVQHLRGSEQRPKRNDDLPTNDNGALDETRSQLTPYELSRLAKPQNRWENENYLKQKRRGFNSALFQHLRGSAKRQRHGASEADKSSGLGESMVKRLDQRHPGLISPSYSENSWQQLINQGWHLKQKRRHFKLALFQHLRGSEQLQRPGATVVNMKRFRRNDNGYSRRNGYLMEDGTEHFTRSWFVGLG